MRRAVIPVVILCAMLANNAAAAGDNGAGRGRSFVQKYCSRCHAIGLTGNSPYAPAPPFRTLHERYDVGDLAEAFAEGIIVAHEGGPQMPRFMLQPSQIDDLISYLRSIQPKNAT